MTWEKLPPATNQRPSMLGSVLIWLFGTFLIAIALIEYVAVYQKVSSGYFNARYDPCHVLSPDQANHPVSLNSSAFHITPLKASNDHLTESKESDCGGEKKFDLAVGMGRPQIFYPRFWLGMGVLFCGFLSLLWGFCVLIFAPHHWSGRYSDYLWIISGLAGFFLCLLLIHIGVPILAERSGVEREVSHHTSFSIQLPSTL